MSNCRGGVRTADHPGAKGAFAEVCGSSFRIRMLGLYPKGTELSRTFGTSENLPSRDELSFMDARMRLTRGL
ncbi:hypothetical protein G8C92_14475 [Paenibacillus donghaensis]|nr:hypothetical protein [Paenibacillus donghaensis]